MLCVLWYCSGGVLGMLGQGCETLGPAASMLRLLACGFDPGSSGGGAKENRVPKLCTKFKRGPWPDCSRNHHMGPCCMYCLGDTAQYRRYRNTIGVSNEVEIMCAEYWWRPCSNRVIDIIKLEI